MKEYQLQFEKATVRSQNGFARWKDDARSTEEFFPRRRLFRPRVKFKRKPRKDSNRSCSKNYQYPRADSPGLLLCSALAAIPKLLVYP